MNAYYNNLAPVGYSTYRPRPEQKYLDTKVDFIDIENPSEGDTAIFVNHDEKLGFVEWLVRSEVTYCKARLIETVSGSKVEGYVLQFCEDSRISGTVRNLGCTVITSDTIKALDSLKVECYS